MKSKCHKLSYLEYRINKLINKELEEKQLLIQSYQNIYNYYNQSMHRRQNKIEKLNQQLMVAKAEYSCEAEDIEKRKLNDSFEKIEFSEGILIQSFNPCFRKYQE